ncbi:uroporphyrinogen decarboxylase family protein [Emticicia sp. 17c]|uniref:uroporphyrinogen decarboxylase family protein n=1 Tax=Emticicia sp. 17c TaxID=3127704 RepID=UPI00301C7261
MAFLNQETLHTQRLVSFWKHHPIADQKAELLAKQTLNFQKKFNCDFIKITPAGSWQAVCHGITDAWEGDFLGRRIIKKTVINTPDNWLTLPDFSKKQPALMQEIVGACQLVYEQKTDNTPVMSTVFCPVSQAIQIAGLPIFLEHIQQYPDKVLAGIEQITQNTLYVIGQLIEAGSQGIYFVTQHMRHGALTPELYEKFGKDSDERCLNACKNLLYNIFHIHGADVYLSLGSIPSNCFIHYEYTPEITISPIVLKKYASRLLVGLPASEMEKCQHDHEMHRLIAQTTPGNMITAGCVLPLDFPEESILKWMSVSKNYVLK